MSNNQKTEVNADISNERSGEPRGLLFWFELTFVITCSLLPFVLNILSKHN